MDWFLDLFYYEGDILKTFVAIFGFFFAFLMVLEGLYILKSAVRSNI